MQQRVDTPRPSRAEKRRIVIALQGGGLTRMATGLIIVAIVCIGQTNPSGAQINRGARTETTPSPHDLQDSNAARFGRCLRDWDKGTHMTKKEWSGACQRLLIERGDYSPQAPFTK